MSQIEAMVRAQGLVIRPGDRDRKALRRCRAPTEDLAAAFCAMARGKWGDRWDREHLSLHHVIDRLDGFLNMQAERRNWTDRVIEGVTRYEDEIRAAAGLAAEVDIRPPPAPEAVDEARRIWASALGELQLGMSTANFESYLAASRQSAVG